MDAAGDYTLSASDDKGDLPSPNSNTFTINAAAHYHLLVSQNTASEFTAGQFSSAVTVQVVDQFGNAVPNQDVALTTSADAAGGVTGQFFDADGETNLNGDLDTGETGTASFYYIDTLAGAPTLTLHDNTASENDAPIADQQLTETVDPGPVFTVQYVSNEPLCWTARYVHNSDRGQ